MTQTYRRHSADGLLQFQVQFTIFSVFCLIRTSPCFCLYRIKKKKFISALMFTMNIYQDIYAFLSHFILENHFFFDFPIRSSMPLFLKQIFSPNFISE